MIADTSIKRPALRYYGGKWNLAPWIISHFPPHKNYAEPCGGAASVLLQKPRSSLETYNDLDGNVVNFFRVLREKPDELIRKIRLTPWARAEFEIARYPSNEPVESARLFYISSWMSISAMPHDKTTGMRMVKNLVRDTGFMNCAITDESVEHLIDIAYRLSDVQIENKPYKEFISMYDADDTLIFFDPPYISDTRSNKSVYVFEWTNAQHIEAASFLRECASYVAVSGYAIPLYSELYEAHGWTRVDKESRTNSGGKRIESLWLSPRIVEALNMPSQATLL